MSNDQSVESKLNRILQIQAELDLRKALYEEFDRLVVELAKSGFAHAELNGLVLELKDNFAESNTGWTSAAVKRFDLKVTPKDKYDKRMAKLKGAV